MADFPASATGYLALSGTCVSDTTLPNNVEATAGNRIDLFGPCIGETFDPVSAEFAADGILVLSGEGSYETSPPQDPHVATGCLILEGVCSWEAAEPCLPIMAYAATGSLALIGPCSYDTPSDGRRDFTASATGGLFLGGRPLAETIRPGEVGFACAAVGGLELFGPCRADSPQVARAFVASTRAGAPVLLISSDCTGATLYPRADVANARGGLVFLTPQVNQIFQEHFETWALTGQLYEPGLFTNFDFNSFCVFQGKAYGCKDDGLYLLEGEDDDGQEIHDGARIGPHNLGIDREKRLRALRLAAGGSAQVRIEVDGKEGYFEIEDGRVPVTQDLQGREWTIDVADFKELNQVEIVPLVLWRR